MRDLTSRESNGCFHTIPHISGSSVEFETPRRFAIA